MKSEKDLMVSELFRSVGREYYYQDVEARFYPFKEFKSTWCRNRQRAEFRISDYLKWADDAVLEDFARCLFGRISSRGRREVYTDRLRTWLQSQEFILRNRPLYLERSRNLTLSSAGRVLDLHEIRDNLKNKGLIEDSSDAFLSWTVCGNVHRVGYCSIIMRVIAISSILDTASMPDYVAEYVLYHEILHLESGRGSLSSGHGREFRMKEKMYPEWREADEWLKKVASKRAPGS
ncbi:MAG: M48 family metallopeptidase [Methanomassiliicoccales archaeon]|nr:M48 family metallopeptidase [Methanomassiliicoccales archaeon]